MTLHLRTGLQFVMGIALASWMAGCALSTEPSQPSEATPSTEAAASTSTTASHEATPELVNSIGTGCGTPPAPMACKSPRGWKCCGTDGWQCGVCY